MNIYKGLGNAALALGWSPEAVTYYRAAIKEANNLTNWRQLGLAYWGLAIACRKINDLIGARDAFQQALIIFERRESPQLVAPLRLLFGNLLTALGDHPEAEHQLQLSLELANRLGDAFTQANTLGNIASLHIARQEHAQAIRIARQAVQIAQGKHDHRTEGQLHLILASAYEGQQDCQAAEQEIQEAIRILELTQDSAFLGQAYEQYGAFLAAQGAYKQAYEHMHLAYTVTLPRAH